MSNMAWEVYEDGTVGQVEVLAKYPDMFGFIRVRPK